MPRVIGCSGAIWLDVDGDGRKTPAYGYAQRLVAASSGNPDALLKGLSDYDEAVVLQAAHLFQRGGRSWFTPQATMALKKASPEIRNRVRTYLEAWKNSPFARQPE